MSADTGTPIVVPLGPSALVRHAKPLSVDLCLCCNDRNGLSRGWFDAMDISTAAGVEVELRDLPRTLVRDFHRDQQPMVQISRWKFRRLYFAAHNGNLLWDAYGIPHNAEFESLIRSMQRRGAMPEALSVPDSCGLEPRMDAWASLVLLKPSDLGRVGKVFKRDGTTAHPGDAIHTIDSCGRTMPAGNVVAAGGGA